LLSCLTYLIAQLSEMRVARRSAEMVTQQGIVPVAVKIIQWKQAKTVAASKAEVAREVQVLKLMWHKPYWVQQVSPELQFVGEQYGLTVTQ